MNNSVDEEQVDGILSPTDVLELLRPLVLVVDGFGQIRQVHGALGGLLGYHSSDLIGKSVLEIVGSRDRLEVDEYFGPEATQTFDPQPFSYIGQIVAADGSEHDVAVYIGGKTDANNNPLWVVSLIPASLDASRFDTLDAEISGEPRSVIRQLLADSLNRNDSINPSGSFFVDLISQPVPIVAGCKTLHQFDGVAAQAVESGWHPWESDSKASFVLYDNNKVPSILRDALKKDKWHIIGIAKVMIDNVLMGAFLFAVDPSKTTVEISGSTNLHGRIANLIKAAGIVLKRWIEHDKLSLEASTDRLTGLNNRSTLDQVQTSDERNSLLYIDIDHFKSINDTWGHQIGDEVLIIVARRLESACRPADTIIRLGGDEFVVVLPDVSTTVARQIGERILKEINKPLNIEEGPEAISVSVGLSSVDSLSSTQDLTDLLASADSNLLQAKRLGRSRLETTHEE